jgi:hypothetical protein
MYTDSDTVNVVVKAAIAVRFGWYNFCRTHKTIRVTRQSKPES